ncbi:uncharacterized protein SOCG_02519 [Schizosaccharomyces octosporus yFS286]|uniref:Uncharacterized protein n=1 Tax=Schizosaccharomyces octosporus (strain yFS286) TaxID=483514 RepID=S9Q199_SCHOY|nr:uncharacterized protein SOCG_02519 [Schizosaccharomyces octosporus yFS286]EPX75041.1 hypothetical protein SOCG_02519 [Schizosaccharomyces octosporus yFS286]
MEFPAELEGNLLDSYFWNIENSNGLEQQILEVQKHYAYNKSLTKEICSLRSELDETRKHLKSQEAHLQLEYGEYEIEANNLQKKLESFSTEMLKSRISAKLRKKQDDLGLLNQKLIKQDLSAFDYATLVLQTMNN